MTYVMQMHPVLAARVIFGDEDMFLRSFDFDADDGWGEGDFTGDPREAMQFASRAEALRYWRRVSPKHPTRDDGRPNRPLTAWHVTIAPLSDFTTQEVQRG